MLPHKKSIGWTYTVSKFCKLKLETVSSSEPKKLDKNAEKDFKAYFNKQVKKLDVPPGLWLAHDEFNEFFLGLPKASLCLQYRTVDARKFGDLG